MREWRIAAAVTALLLAVAGCSSGQDDDKSSSGGPTDQGGTSGSSVDGGTVSFGDPVEYRDGLSIVVSDPEKFKPSARAITGTEKKFVKVEVRLVNDTGKKVSPADVYVTVASDGGQAADVIDPKQGMTAGPPKKAVQPGGEATWVLGFGLIDDENVEVQVQPGINPAPVTFAS